jgi:hypothetical protein
MRILVDPAKGAFPTQPIPEPKKAQAIWATGDDDMTPPSHESSAG